MRAQHCQAVQSLQAQLLRQALEQLTKCTTAAQDILLSLGEDVRARTCTMTKCASEL